MFNFKNVSNPQKVTANANGFQSESNFVNRPPLELRKNQESNFDQKNTKMMKFYTPDNLDASRIHTTIVMIAEKAKNNLIHI